jgi:hypothetical protein
MRPKEEMREYVTVGARPHLLLFQLSAFSPQSFLFL